MLLSDVNPDEAEESEVKNNSTLSDSDQTSTDDEIQWIDFNEFQNEDQKSNYEEIIEEEEHDDGSFYVDTHIWEEVLLHKESKDL